jgi:2-dehydropantoate 2-reductase
VRLLDRGAGGIGGPFDGRLVEGGADVTFLVRPVRKAELDERSLRIRSPLGDRAHQLARVAAKAYEARRAAVRQPRGR